MAGKYDPSSTKGRNHVERDKGKTKGFSPRGKLGFLNKLITREGTSNRPDAGPSGQRRNSRQPAKKAAFTACTQLQTKRNESVGAEEKDAQTASPTTKLDDLILNFKIPEKFPEKHPGGVPPTLRHSNENLPYTVPLPFTKMYAPGTSRKKRASVDSGITSISSHSSFESPVDNLRCDWNRRNTARVERLLAKFNTDIQYPDRVMVSSPVDGRKSTVRFSNDVEQLPEITRSPTFKIKKQKWYRRVFRCCLPEESPPPKRESILRNYTPTDHLPTNTEINELV